MSPFYLALGLGRQTVQAAVQGHDVQTCFKHWHGHVWPCTAVQIYTCSKHFILDPSLCYGCPEIARCTNRCTCRKNIGIAQPTNQELTKTEENMPTRKIARLTKISPRAGRLGSQWLRIRREQSSDPNRVRIKLYFTEMFTLLFKVIENLQQLRKKGCRFWAWSGAKVRT